MSSSAEIFTVTDQGDLVTRRDDNGAISAVSTPTANQGLVSLVPRLDSYQVFLT